MLKKKRKRKPLLSRADLLVRKQRSSINYVRTDHPCKEKAAKKYGGSNHLSLNLTESAPDTELGTQL